MLYARRDAAKPTVNPQLKHQPLQVNQSLWQVADALRDCEHSDRSICNWAVASDTPA